MKAKLYRIKTVYRDGVTTYDLIEALPDIEPEAMFDLHLMSMSNTDEETESISMLEYDSNKVIANFNFPV